AQWLPKPATRWIPCMRRSLGDLWSPRRGRAKGGRNVRLARNVRLEDGPGEKVCVDECQPVAEPLAHEAQLGVIFPQAEIEGVAVRALDAAPRVMSPPGSFPRLGFTKLVE